MTITRIEALPASWSEVRDVPFFSITARLFSTDFCLGASVMLTANDAEDDGIIPQGPEPPIDLDGTRQPVILTEAELIPVRARRAAKD